MCMVDPKISVRRDLGALVRRETIAVPYTTMRRFGACGVRLDLSIIPSPLRERVGVRARPGLDPGVKKVSVRSTAGSVRLVNQVGSGAMHFGRQD